MTDALDRLRALQRVELALMHSGETILHVVLDAAITRGGFGSRLSIEDRRALLNEAGQYEDFYLYKALRDTGTARAAEERGRRLGLHHAAVPVALASWLTNENGDALTCTIAFEGDGFTVRFAGAEHTATSAEDVERILSAILPRGSNGDAIRTSLLEQVARNTGPWA